MPAPRGGVFAEGTVSRSRAAVSRTSGSLTRALRRRKRGGMRPEEVYEAISTATSPSLSSMSSRLGPTRSSGGPDDLRERVRPGRRSPAIGQRDGTRAAVRPGKGKGRPRRVGPLHPLRAELVRERSRRPLVAGGGAAGAAGHVAAGGIAAGAAGHVAAAAALAEVVAGEAGEAARPAGDGVARAAGP